MSERDYINLPCPYCGGKLYDVGNNWAHCEGCPESTELEYEEE